MWKNYIEMIEAIQCDNSQCYIDEFSKMFSIKNWSVNQIENKLLKNKEVLYPEVFCTAQALNEGNVSLIVNIIKHLEYFKHSMMLSPHCEPLDKILFNHFAFCPETLLSKDSEGRVLLFLFLYFHPNNRKTSLLFPARMHYALTASPKITTKNFKMLITLQGNKHYDYLCHDMFLAKIEFMDNYQKDKAKKYLPKRINSLWDNGYTFNLPLRKHTLLTNDVLSIFIALERIYHQQKLTDKLFNYNKKHTLLKI